MPIIHHADSMTEAMRRYWLPLSERLSVDVVDPWRYSLEELGEAYGEGVTVYRAATRGKWGRSAEVVRLARKGSRWVKGGAL